MRRFTPGINNPHVEWIFKSDVALDDEKIRGSESIAEFRRLVITSDFCNLKVASAGDGE